MSAFAKAVGFNLTGQASIDEAVDITRQWVNSFISGGEPWWLTLSGASDLSKTHLLTGVFKILNGRGLLSSNQSGVQEQRVIVWPEIMLGLRSSRGYATNDLLSAAADWKAVFLDELKADGDTTGYSTGVLANLLSARTGKWTLITTNLTLGHIERFDARIASRMIRAGSRFVQMQGKRYCER